MIDPPIVKVTIEGNFSNLNYGIQVLDSVLNELWAISKTSNTIERDIKDPNTGKTVYRIIASKRKSILEKNTFLITIKIKQCYSLS